jgi:hypothetical protein
MDLDNNNLLLDNVNNDRLFNNDIYEDLYEDLYEDDMDDKNEEHKLIKIFCKEIEEIIINSEGKIINMLKNKNPINYINYYYTIEGIILFKKITIDIIKNLINLNLEKYDNKINYILLKKSNELFYFKFSCGDSKILKLYIYNIENDYFFYNMYESNFDINTIYKDINGYNIFKLFFNTSNIEYCQVQNRIKNKFFCCLSNDLPVFIKNNQLFYKQYNYFFYSKLLYAQDLIYDGWIMDEFDIKYDNSNWTLNYWKNYVNKIDLIKLCNKQIIDNKCYCCKEHFNDDDIVFNYSHFVFHFNCLKIVLYN